MNQLIELAEKFEKEIDIKDKRISLLTETLESRNKDIETLKTTVLKYYKALLNLADYVLPQQYKDETLQILGIKESEVKE